VVNNDEERKVLPSCCGHSYLDGLLTAPNFKHSHCFRQSSMNEEGWQPFPSLLPRALLPSKTEAGSLLTMLAPTFMISPFLVTPNFSPISSLRLITSRVISRNSIASPQTFYRLFSSPLHLFSSIDNSTFPAILNHLVKCHLKRKMKGQKNALYWAVSSPTSRYVIKLQ